MRVAAIVPAAGKGRRLKSRQPKPFVPVRGRPLLIHTLRNLKKAFSFSEIILAVNPGTLKAIQRLLARHKIKGVRTVAGGRTRAQSVGNALGSVSPDCDWVLVHDAARPLVSRTLVGRLLKGARRSGAVISALPVSSTVKKTDASQKIILRTQDRETLYLAQTPQVFRKDLLVGRYKQLGTKAFKATDEAALFDGSGVRVKIVEGEARNIKVTTPEDIELMKFYLLRAKR